ncbi:hypothetical protein AGMMS49975_19490 [Clostridia bacterium]|nr:hypothetical protein AGMMS49975_19490 [Clostridia bacterium]
MEFNVDKIIGIIEEKGYTCYAVEKSLGFGNGAIKRWATNSPSINKLIELSNFLKIDLGLFFYEEVPKPSTPPHPPADADIDGRERLLVDNFRELNDEQKRFLVNQSARLLSAVEDKLSTSKSSANTATATNRPVPPADSPEYSEISGIA